MIESIASEQGKTLAGPEHIDFLVLNTLQDVAAVSTEWDALLSRSTCNRAFSSSKWYLATCRFHSTMKPHVVVARRGTTLIGVLPLVSTGSGPSVVFPNYLSDYSDIIAARDDAFACAGLLRHALSDAQGYQKITLSNVRLDSNCVRALKVFYPAREVEELYRVSRACHYIALPASYDEYLETRGRRFRKNIRQTGRRAARNHVIVRELEPATFPPTQLPEVFLDLLLNRHTNQTSFKSAIAQSFVKEVLPALFTERSLRAFALFEDEGIVGIDLCLMGDNSLCGWNSGFLATAAHWSPGKLLTDAGIRQAFAMSMEEYDFMRGDEAYKASWTNGSRPIGEIELTLGDLIPV